MKPRIGLTLRVSESSVYLPRVYVKTVLEFGGIPFLFSDISSEEDVNRLVDSIDGLLIPGGGDIHPSFYGERPGGHLKGVYREKDFLDLTLVRKARSKGIPVLGICRGAQVINVAFGGTLYQHLKHRGVDHVQGLPYEYPTHEIRILEGSFLHKLVGKETLKVNSFHHQAVKELGEGLKAVAWAPDGVIEAVEGEGFLLGLQPHIEWLWRSDETWKKVFRAFIEASVS